MLSKEALEIIKKKNIDLWWILNVYTLDWYNRYRRHKLINKKLTQKEFDLLKEWIENDNN